MVKANELRHGNLFFIADLGVFPLSDFSLDFTGQLHQMTFLSARIFDKDRIPDQTIQTLLPDIWQVNEIPLTAGWLERIGFADTSGGYRATGAEVVYELKTKTGKAIRLWWEWPDKWRFESWNDCLIQYVHQLQNLFNALCGEELTIKS